MPDLPVPFSPNLPAAPGGKQFDRAAVERILARAAELQGKASDDSPDGDAGLSAEQVLAAGTEVGLSPALIRQALAEERTRVLVPQERGLAAQVAGASVATATRLVDGTPAEILSALNTMMTRDARLAVKRRWVDRITWEPRRDVFAAFRKLFPGTDTLDFLRAEEVAATVIPISERQVSVRLDADVSRARTQRLEQGGALAVSGIAGGGGIVGVAVLVHVAMLVPVVAIAAIPALSGLVAGYAVASSHRTVLERTQVALEQVLDRLEHGDMRRLAPGPRGS
jgi:hypothetical protein